MATFVTLTVPVEDIIGADYDPRRTAVHIGTNTPDGLIVVDGTTLRVGGRREKIGSSGTVQFANLVATNSASNPTSFAYRVQIVYTPVGSREQKVWTSSDFSLTTSANLAAISEAFDGLAISPTWQSDFMDSAQSLLAQQEQLSGILDAADAQAYNIAHNYDVQSALADPVNALIATGVPPLIAEQIAAANPEIAAAAAALAASDAGLVRKDDVPGESVAWGIKTPSTAGRRLGWNAADENGLPFAETIDLLRSEMVDQATIIRKTIGPTGCDFTGPVAANTWALTQPRSFGRWIEFVVEPGTYTIAAADLDWRVARYTIHRARQTWSVTYQGDGGQDQPDSVVNTKSTVYMRDSGQLSGIVVTAKNLRYAIHSDDAGTNVNTTLRLTDGVRAIHYGNADAAAWRTANPGSGLSAASVLLARPAWGQGTASGQTTKITDTDLRGTDSPVLFHNNLNFISPSVVEMERCTLSGYGTVTGVPIQSLGSGTADVLRMKDCSMLPVPLVKHSDDIWRPDTPDRQVADHREWHVVLDNTLAGYWPNLRGRALRVVSAGTGTGSRVRFSGTAAPVLIGTETDRDGGGGLAGYAYGSLDMSNILVGWNGTTNVANNLGKRLGDRTSAPVTLTITTEAGSANVVFNANHNAQSDATILGLINTALGSLGTASLYDVGGSEYYPDCCERQTVAYNATATGIPRWSIVAWDTSRGTIKLAPTNAPLDTIAGVALEPIPPGTSGRVLRAGIMLNNQLAGGFAVANNAGVYLSDTTPGAVTATVGTGRLFGRGIGTSFLTRFDTRTSL